MMKGATVIATNANPAPKICPTFTSSLSVDSGLMWRLKIPTENNVTAEFRALLKELKIAPAMTAAKTNPV